ncbi:MAG: hypothetical protein Q8Q14_03435 [Gemmatimonadales bacterium]|nr:hypothetical protein [Gemmatimonadales bacterium]
MPLAQQQFDQLIVRWKPFRQQFAKAWPTLVAQQLTDVDERVRGDVEVMPAFALLRPLPDADRVLCRQRLLWLLADATAIRGTLPLAASWTLPESLRALAGEDGTAERCPRPAAELRLLLALVDFYADRVLVERLVPRATEWIEAATGEIVRELRVPDREWGTVHGVVLGLTQKAMLEHLKRLGQLDAVPTQIRQAPYRAYESGG